MLNLVVNGTVVLEKKIFFILSMYFHYFNIIFHFCYYLPLEKSVGCHLKKRESPPSKKGSAKFGRNWPSGSGEKDF